MNVSYLARWGTLLAVLLVTACGGGGSADGSAAPVARVEITPAGALLTGAGQSRRLAAQAYDADGNPVDATFTWSSGRASSVSVDPSGVITAQAAIGSAQIVAEAGGVRSPPALAVVAQPVAGALLVSDDQVVGEPEEVDPGAAPRAANTYRVTIQGVSAPAVGDVVIGTGGKPVAGQVVAVTRTATQAVVTLRPVPLNQLFADLKLHEVFDLSDAPVQYPDRVLAAFDVRRDGTRFTFTEKPTARASAAPRMRPLADSDTFSMGPFDECKVSPESVEDALPTFDAPLSIEITISPSAEWIYDAAAGINKLVVKAVPKIEGAPALALSTAFEATLTCRNKMLTYFLPVTGALAWAGSFVVPVGVGFELGGKLTFASAKIGAKYSLQTELALGYDCGPASCKVVAEADADGSVKPDAQIPNVDSDSRFEPSLEFFGFVDLKFGSPVWQSLQFELLKTRLGAKLEGSFAFQTTQILDADYRSNYAASVAVKESAGVSLTEAAQVLGLSDLVTLELEQSKPFAASPQGSVKADKAEFSIGDVVTFEVQIDPATANFVPALAAPYNIDRILIVRKQAGTLAEEVAFATAAAGQTTFTVPWTATTSGKADEFYAFVVTQLLPADLLALELGQAHGPALVEARLLVGEPSTNGGCDVSAQSQDANDGSGFVGDFDRKTGGSFQCSASIGPATATSSAVASSSGTTHVPTGPADPGIPVSTIAAQGSASLNASLAVTGQADRIVQAGSRGQSDALGHWMVFAGSQPLAFHLTLELEAQTGSGATFSIMNSSGEILTSHTICPGYVAGVDPATWMSRPEVDCVSAQNLGLKQATYSGTLAAGGSLRLIAMASVHVQGDRWVRPSGSSGPSGATSTSATYTFKLDLTPP